MAKQGKWVKQEAGAVEAIENGISEIESLKDEMSEWRDNMEDKLSGTQKFEDVSQCADDLDTGHDGLQSALDELQEAITSLEGSPFKAGCPEHVPGTPCKRCDWKGIVRKPSYEPTLEIHETPKLIKSLGGGQLLVARLQISVWEVYYFTVDPGASAEEIAKDLATARERFAKDHADWAADNAPDKLIPARLPDEPEVLPMDALDDISDTKATWQDWSAYGRKSISRADRLSNASSAVTAGLEAIRERCESYNTDDSTESDERVDAVLSVLEDLESALGELEGVEFPGMYG
jgi:hypothetical protein